MFSNNAFFRANVEPHDAIWKHSDRLGSQPSGDTPKIGQGIKVEYSTLRFWRQSRIFYFDALADFWLDCCRPDLASCFLGYGPLTQKSKNHNRCGHDAALTLHLYSFCATISVSCFLLHYMCLVIVHCSSDNYPFKESLTYMFTSFAVIQHNRFGAHYG